LFLVVPIVHAATPSLNVIVSSEIAPPGATVLAGGPGSDFRSASLPHPPCACRRAGQEDFCEGDNATAASLVSTRKTNVS
jgi:hypothetical protein